MGTRGHEDPAILLFAMLGGALALLAWLVGRAALARFRTLSARERARADTERVAASTLDEPGATPGNPIVVRASSIIDAHAKRLPCARCGREVDLIQHHARSIAGQRMRVLDVQCRWCGHARPLYFALAEH